MNHILGTFSKNLASKSFSTEFGFKIIKFKFTDSYKWNNDLNSRESTRKENEKEYDHCHRNHHPHKKDDSSSKFKSINSNLTKENTKTLNDELVREVFPNINITTACDKKDRSSENYSNNHHLNSTKKIYGNMTGMEKIDEYVSVNGKDIENFLKDEPKTISGRPSDESSQFTFRGDLNTDSNPAPKKDITDEPKKI